jgi:hypothetical protein
MGAYIFCQGDEVFVTSADCRTIIGKVEMISRDQVSVFVTFNGIIGDHVGSLPVICHDQSRGRYRSIIDGMAVTLRVVPPQQQDGAPDGQTTRNKRADANIL